MWDWAQRKIAGISTVGPYGFSVENGKMLLNLPTSHYLHVLFFLHGSGFEGDEEDEQWVQQAQLGQACSAFSPSFSSAI